MSQNPQLRIPKIQSHLQTLQSAISEHAQLSTENLEPLQIQIQQVLAIVEGYSQRAELTPASLSSKSQTIYAWMKFLSEEANLAHHISALHQLYQRVQVIKSPRGFALQPSHAFNQVTIEFMNMAGLYRYRQQGQHRLIQINEGFITAEEDVLSALATLLVKGKNRQLNTVIRQYSLTENYSEIQLAMELGVTPVSDTAQGNAYDLKDSFERVNQEYFQGSMEPPHLSWSRTRTRRKFGHYEPSRHRIVLSRTLDQPSVPSYVVDFVMYHELLHIKHGEVWQNGRRRVHTPAFRQDERQFQRYQEAEGAIAKLATAP